MNEEDILTHHEKLDYIKCCGYHVQHGKQLTDVNGDRLLTNICSV